MNLYEIGKWAGDRVGFPRVGIVNKEIELIKDTFEFLNSLTNRNKITIEIQRQCSDVNVNKFRKTLARKLNISKNDILVTENKYMRGKYAFRVFTQSRKIFKRFQLITDDILSMTNKEIRKFLAGFADAEATIDTRNQLVSFSISNKKIKEAERIKTALQRVLQVPIKIRTAGKIELKIEVPHNGIKNFNEKIGRYMKHPEKLKRMNGEFISKRDREILGFIKINPNSQLKI